MENLLDGASIAKNRMLLAKPDEDTMKKRFWKAWKVDLRIKQSRIDFHPGGIPALSLTAQSDPDQERFQKEKKGKVVRAHWGYHRVAIFHGSMFRLSRSLSLKYDIMTQVINLKIQVKSDSRMIVVYFFHHWETVESIKINCWLLARSEKSLEQT